MLPENKELSQEFSKLLRKKGFLENEIGVAIIDLKNPKPEIFGYNLDHFMYPASVYKVFIGAEMLRQIEIKNFSLEQIVQIKSPNDVDKDARIFPGDSRKLLAPGDKVTIDYLIDLMLTRSDNTASNTLIDLVGRENITKNIIHKYNWQGSEVTRKFIERTKENEPYQFSQTTLACVRHLAEFFYLIENSSLISPFVSHKLKEYMLHWNRKGRQGLFLPGYVAYYRKGGWLETNLWTHSIRSAIKSISEKGWSVIRWSNDVGVVTGTHSKYVVALLSVNKSILPTNHFPMQKLAQTIYKFMEAHKKN